MKYVNVERVRTSVDELVKAGDTAMFRLATADGCSEELLVSVAVWSEAKTLLKTAMDAVEQMNDMAELMVKMAHKLDTMEERMLVMNASKGDEAE